MKRLLAVALVAVFLCPQAAFSITQYRSSGYTDNGVSIALEDPIGSVYRDGEAVRLSVRTDSDAYVVVFDIDTEGFVHLLYPRDGKTLRRISANRIYYIPEYEDESLVVAGKKGIEFVFALAAPHHDDFDMTELGFLIDSDKLPLERRFRIDGDPFLAANRIAGQLIRGISHRNGVTMSFTYFYLNEAVDFPRYLCTDCYETGKDPYGPNMPVYVASADFEKTDRLSYPLERGFVEDYGNVAVADYRGDAGGTSTTQVYVTYYPRWDDGFYSRSWYYMDPWYWSWYYWPYTGSGWYFNIGWNWGWGGCHYYYFPYYYCGPYYAYRPCYPYYSHYPSRCYDAPGRPYYHRNYRPSGKYGTSDRLYAAMNHKTDRGFRSTSRSIKPGLNGQQRTTLASSYRAGGTRYSYKAGKEVRTSSKLVRAPGIVRNGGGKSYQDVRGKYRRIDGSSTIRSTKRLHREQRIITRSKTGSAGSRVFDQNRYKRTIDPRDINRYKRTRSSNTRTWNGRSTNRTQVKPRSTTGSKSSRTRAYKPSSRRNSGSKSGSGTKYRAPSRSSSSRSSATRSKGSSGGSRSSSSRGKGRK
ncbi:MAG: DUF4384 domain-containing protein [bacterium]